ncbi:MAG TPA: penicillin-binding protein 1C [Polyangiaceae bacterium]|nr:penicillin-binding protein 1C [Polyangiaceae bacterium]
MRRLRLVLLAALGALLLPWAGLVLAASVARLPTAFSGSVGQSSVVVVDRDGRLLREVRVGQGARVEPTRLEELSPWVVPALLAAEDGRFFEHPGVDPLAVARALGQLVLERRVVSGASTLTQQLTRSVVPRPRTLSGKLREMALALRIEASLSKRRILEEYVSRVEFGPNLVGIEAASRHYFQKPAAALDLAEAAALVSLPRSPSLYDPCRRPQLLERRRLRVLERLGALGLATPAEIARAELTPVRIVAAAVPQGAEHLSLALAGRFGGMAGRSGEHTRLLRTTLNAELQRAAERIARSASPTLARHSGDAIALVVLDNASADVLAYVGSPGYFDAQHLGANDGVVAKRQPGSALKPFVYAAAMQELGYSPATLLPDLPRDFSVPGGSFAPRNYDQRFRGPVLLRQALGSSLNLPALEVSSRLGPPRLLATLHRFGFASLNRDAEHYGVGLALGDGEVTLLELVTAYSALARGGELRAPRFVLSRSGYAGEASAAAVEPPRRVLRAELAALLSDVLSDDAARAAGFGRDSVLTFPFPVAAKTGTSKGFRDNWALGYTHEVTVGVWVGNFDGAPLRDASGITAAGPAFHELMLVAMQGREPAPLFDPDLLARAEICALSGKAPGPYCRARRLERFAPGHLPSESCDIHVEAHVDASGRQVDPSCGGSVQVLESYPDQYLSWARQAHRPLAGAHLSPTCPPRIREASAPSVTFPRDDQTFALDSDGPTRQEIVLTAASSASTVRFIIDGQPTRPLTPPFRLPWPLAPGSHTLMAEANGSHSSPITFRVLPTNR